MLWSVFMGFFNFKGFTEEEFIYMMVVQLNTDYTKTEHS